MRILGVLTSVLFVLCFPVLLLSSNLRYAANDIRLYQYGFDKYDATAKTGIDRDGLRGIGEELIGYFNSDEEPIPINLFNEREVTHLRDVKGLIRLDYRLQQIALAYIVGYAALSLVFSRLIFRRTAWLRDLAKRLVWGSGLSIAILLILGLGALFDFHQLFLWFHLISFSNQLWILAPTDYLLRMFPAGFFLDATLMIAGATIAEALIIGGISGGYLALTRKSSRRG